MKLSEKRFHQALITVYLVVLLLVALGLTAAGSPPRSTSAGVILKAQQSVMVTCLGDELIITPYGNQQAELTCRVWVTR